MKMQTRQMILDFDGQRLAGQQPFAVFEAKNGAFRWHKLDSAPRDFEFESGSGDALAELRCALAWSRANYPDGAAIGFIAYDFARQLEPRAFAQTSSPDDLQIPDIRLTFCRSSQRSEVRSRRSEVRSQKPEARSQKSASRRLPPADSYLQSVACIKEFIAAGDIYQANLTRRFEAPLPCSPGALYERLRAAHPMPFSALLEWDDLAIVSNSPERFLRLRGRELLAQPIKGTIRRGETPEHDAALQIELQNSAKNRAENVMIVDLLRNDLGRVCEYGSVRVPRLCAIQTFPTLHHLVSDVTGLLRDDCDALDVMRATFPCGSITGAPKIRAMQIIDELEPVRRGAAMGAIGYFGFGGDIEWNVAIRTITCKNGAAYFHAGGGIVADSEAQSEHDEVLLKAQALIGALDI